MTSAALAVFAKTPGLTPAKTRLAQAVGTDKAEAFYLFSLAETEKKLQALRAELPELQAYWAVAEPEAVSHRRWQAFQALDQGEGELGDRLHKVYSQLFAAHEGVFLFGTDSPHIKTSLLIEAYHALEEHDFVVGPTDDGGFYLFGARKAIQAEQWKAVTYSADSTLEELKTSLGGDFFELPVQYDIDTIDELQRLAAEDSRYQKFL